MANKSIEAGVLREFVNAVRDASAGRIKATEYLSGVVTHTDVDGTVWVNVAGGVNDMPVARTTASYSPGDVVSFSIENGVASIGGNVTDPGAPISKQITVEKRVVKTEETVEKIGNIVADKADITELNAATARIGNLEADHVSTTDLQAETARVDNLLAGKASVADLNAATGRIDDLEADHVSTTDLQAVNGEITNLKAKDVAIEGNITAATGRIGTLETENTAVKGRLTAAEGNITTLNSTKANIADIEANYIDADTIEATYMHANMSNSNVAWIQNGVIANGAISSAMINDVSANKLTAGTINGSVINVTNLNADNITTGTINGQRIGEGSLSLDKLSDDVYTESEVDAKLSTMQQQIDGAIETWTGTAVPTLQNTPASSWTTTQLKDQHVGDVYFVVNSQSQQNGYNYRFTKTGSTYSWQLIKDSDVTNALQRLTTAEGKITTFESDISTLQTDTGTLKTKTTSLETRMSDAESDILDKVDTTTFNSLEDTVDGHTQTLSQHTTAISNKADSSTVTSLTTKVNKNETDISGINTTIGELQTTVASKADGSALTTVSNRLNTVSDTVDGHTQTISSVQSTLETKADSSTVSTLTERVSTTESNVSGITTRLTATESVANGVRTDFDNLEVGGRNLLGNTDYLVDGEDYTSRGTTTWASLLPDRYIPLLEETTALDEQYTLSFDGRVSNTPIRVQWRFNYVSTGGTYKQFSGTPSTAVESTEWARYHITLKTPVMRPEDYARSAIIVQSQSGSTTDYVEVRRFKLERGNKPTDWTLAPEDVETDLLDINNDLKSVELASENQISNLASSWQKGSLGASTYGYSESTGRIIQVLSKNEGRVWAVKAGTRYVFKATNLFDETTKIYVGIHEQNASGTHLKDSLWQLCSTTGYKFTTLADTATIKLVVRDGDPDGVVSMTDLLKHITDGSLVFSLVEDLETEVTTLKTDYATYKQTTTESLTQIGTRMTTAEGKIATAETNIASNASAIALKASQSEVDTLTGHVTSAESTITQHATDIAAKVSKNGVIAAINLSTETEGGSAAKISADKVQINGQTTFTAIKQYSDAAYDEIGAASDAVSALTTDLASSSGTTVINGGHITTGTLDANAVNASSGTFDTALIPNLSADKITSGTIDAARINASSLTIGSSTLGTVLDGKADDADIPTKTSDLTNDSNFANTTQVATAKSEAISAAAADATSKANDAKKYATNYIALDPVDGIRIADANPDTATTYQKQTATETEFVVDGESMAEFGADGARIGKTDASHLTLGEDSLSIANAEKITMFNVDMDSGSMDAYVDSPRKYTKHDFVTINSPGSYVFTCTETSDPIEWDGTLTILGSSSVNTIGSRLFRFGLNPSDVSYIGQYAETATDGIYFYGNAPGYPPPSEDFDINACDAICVNENDLEFEYGTAKTVSLSATGYQRLTGGSYTINFALSATISYGGEDTLTAQYRLELQVVSMGSLPLILRWSSWFPSTRRIVPTNGAALTFGTRDTVADVGLLSATFGEGLIAAKPHQAAFGKFNVEDTEGDYALIIGNGTADDARSNALAVKWDGTVVTATPVPIASGGTGATSASAAWTALGGGSIGKKNSLAASDIPNLAASKITSGDFAAALLTNAAKYVSQTKSYKISSGNGTETVEVSMSVPSGYAIKGITKITAGVNAACIYGWSWSGSTVSVWVRNLNSSGWSDSKTMTVGVICTPS